MKAQDEELQTKIMTAVEGFHAAGRDAVREDDVKHAVFLRDEIAMLNAELDLLFRGKIRVEFNDENPEQSKIELVEKEAA
jgi:hypothetical protein